MAEYAENYQRVIHFLDETQFREFVLLYNKLYYNANEGNITDGPYDGGVDLVLRLNRRVRKLNIQVTIQKDGVDKKVSEDVDKAAENVERYEYVGTLYFFISKPISNEKQNEWIEDARKKQIELVIYDSKALADIAASYSDLRKYLGKVVNSVFPQEPVSIDYSTRVLFDAISQQKGVTAVKENIVKAYIQQIIFESGPSTFSTITEKIGVIFSNAVPSSYYQTVIGRMNIEGLIFSEEKDNQKLYDLSPEQRSFFESLQLKEQVNQSELLKRFVSVCSEFGVQLSFEIVYDYVQGMYDDVYNVDLALLSSVSCSSKNLKEIHERFVDYLKGQCASVDIDYSQLAKRLLEVFGTNDSISKRSASKLLVGLLKSNHLEEYLASTKRELLLDTPVLIQYICCLFKDIPNYDYPPYKYVRALKVALDDVCRLDRSPVSVTMFTLEGYMNEVVAHLCDAIQVGRFLGHPEIQILGRSRNSFYSFYKEVSKYEDVGEIDEYIESILTIDTLSNKRSTMEEQIHRALEDSLKSLSFQVRNRIEVENWTELRKKYDFALVGTSGENKSSLARVNDLNAILYQSYLSEDEDSYPYLVTWDNSFISARDALQKDYDGMGSWFLYSPQQLASTLTLLDFKVNPEFITTNILSVIEDTIAEHADVKTLLDVVSEFLDGTGDSEMRIASRIAAVKRSLYCSDVNGSGAGNEVPIDSLLVLVLNHVRTSKEKLDIFEALMSSHDDLSGFIQVLRDGISHSIDGTFLEDAFRKEVDEYLDGFELV